MKRIVPIVAALLLSACASEPNKFGGDLVAEPSKPPVLDTRLTTPCPEFKEKLVDGDEGNILEFIKRLGAHGKNCREQNIAWRAWFDKTFPPTPAKDKP